MVNNTIIPLVALLLSFSLALLVLLRSQRRRGHIIFFLYLIGMSMWAGSIYLFRSSPDAAHALIWERAVMPAVSLQAAAFMHFSYIHTRQKPKNWLLPIAYLLVITSAILSLSNLLVSEIGVDRYGYYPIGGLLFPLVPLHTYTFLTLGMVNFIRGYRTSKDYEERNSYLYAVTGVASFWAGGIVDLASLFGAPIPPLALVGNIFFCFLASIAILKYHLLDIKFVIRKNLSYLLVSTLVALPFVLVFVISYFLLQNRQLGMWFYFLIVVVLALLLQPLWRGAQRFVDRLFYRNRYDYLQAVARFSRQPMLITELTINLQNFIILIGKSLRVESAFILVNSTKENFTGIARYETSPSGLAVELSGVGPLIRWLSQNEAYLNYRDVDTIPVLRAIPESDRNALDSINAEWIVPINSHDKRLVGMIVLGEKLSQEPYSNDDHNLITAARNQIALVLENARLYHELKESEKILKASEEKLRLMFESITESILVIETDGEIIQTNKAAATILNFQTEEELLGKNLFDFVVYKDRSYAMYQLDVALKGDFVGDFEIRLATRDGREFPAELNAAVLKDTQGKPAELIVVADDISERKRMQEQLIATDRLISLGQLVSGIAHELNNPLTSVICISELLLNEATPDNVKEDLIIMNKEAKRTANIVRNLLIFARKQKPAKHPTNINAALQSILELREHEHKLNNIIVQTNLAPVLPPVMADAFQLQQVFMNIILNSEYFMNEAHGKGTINITTKLINSTIRIIFKDDGSGIQPDVLSRLFTPFFTTKPVGRGTGLGLSISFGIIAEHGGRIYAESDAGQGASFIVELPVMEQEQKV